ncbi:MAG: CBS domain-containing protein [Bryobacteraceae bacterium]|jgi:CBS domain-containing protein
MKVRDVMTKQTAFCGPETNLAQAVELMWKNACGFLPVAGEGGNVIGVITDRDISIALGTRDRRASEVCVRSAMSSRLFACTPDDDVHTALKTLKSEGIRRLPVIDREGMLMGVLSIDDVILNARVDALRKDISYADIENTYRAILLRSSLDKNRGRAAA